jgi:calcineurin-like phosphoesterase family protein
MTVWFIADTHFGEQPRARQRASAMSAQELDDVIERRWKEEVRDGDTVWHLGDVGDWRRLAGLPGTKHLVFGNNDKGRRSIAASGVFAHTTVSHQLEIDGVSYELIHDPAHAEPASDRPVIHGHLHAMTSPAPRCLSVSFDRWGWAPVGSEDVIAASKAKMSSQHRNGS